MKKSFDKKPYIKVADYDCGAHNEGGSSFDLTLRLGTSFCFFYNVIPLCKEGKNVTICISSALDKQAIDGIKKVLECSHVGFVYDEAQNIRKKLEDLLYEKT